MRKIIKLTSESIHTRIDRIVENMDLPCDASDAQGLATMLLRDYKAWQRQNKSFLRKNSAQVMSGERVLEEIIQQYQQIRNEIATSDDRDNECAAAGRIWHMMQAANAQLISLQGRLADMLGRAENLVKSRRESNR